VMTVAKLVGWEKMEASPGTSLERPLARRWHWHVSL